MNKGFVEIPAYAWGECGVYQERRLLGLECRLVVAALGKVCGRLEALADLVPKACDFRHTESENARCSSTWRLLTGSFAFRRNSEPTRHRQTAGRDYSDCLSGTTNLSNRGRVLNRALTPSSAFASATVARQGGGSLDHSFECCAQEGAIRFGFLPEKTASWSEMSPGSSSIWEGLRATRSARRPHTQGLQFSTPRTRKRQAFEHLALSNRLLCLSVEQTRLTQRRQTAGRDYSDCLSRTTNSSNRGRVLNRALTPSSAVASVEAVAVRQGGSSLERLFECGAQEGAIRFGFVWGGLRAFQAELLADLIPMIFRFLNRGRV